MLWVFFILPILLPSTTLQCSETVALILARGGSKGIRLKNLREVGGLSLLGRSILTARAVNLKVYVSTDHPLIAFEALKYGAEIVKRSRVTSSDTSPSLWGVSEFLLKYRKVNVVVLIQATSPFIKAESLLDALNTLKGPPVKDCVFSVVRSHKLRWNKTGDSLTPVNFALESRPRRQDINSELVETGAFYLVRRHLVGVGMFQNNK